jgi:hypothetical protein
MKQLEYLNLVSSFETNKTIKLRVNLVPAGARIRPLVGERKIVLDTGADVSAFTKEILMRHGYGNFMLSDKMKNTADGLKAFRTCEINGLLLSNQFKFGKMVVDVLENWDEQVVVGVIGMDILSQMTFVSSHEYKKFLLTNGEVPEMAALFGG